MSRNFAAGVGKQTYTETLDILDEEFAALKRTVAAITPEEWAKPTRLRVNVAFIEVATGRRAHGDSRFPILQ